MDVYVIGVGMHPAARRITDKRLEELVFDTSRAALDDAGVSREEIDHVTIAGCDELDGRSISSMLLSAPAGAYLRDEIKCTDSGLTGLCLASQRIRSGLFELGLVASWNKSSIAPFEDVMRMRCEPFFTRPVGLNMSITDGLFAQAVAHKLNISESEVNATVARLLNRAARNPRRAPGSLPVATQLANSEYVATPLRRGQQAPVTDGAVAFVLASEAWLARHPGHRPLARLMAAGWSSDSYNLGQDRLSNLNSFNTAFTMALSKAGLEDTTQLDLIELDSQTGYHAVAYERTLQPADSTAISPSGGPFAQNPYFCTGLVNAAEAVLQIAGRAGACQLPKVRRAAAHGCHGFAQQGNIVTIFEGA